MVSFRFGGFFQISDAVKTAANRLWEPLAWLSLFLADVVLRSWQIARTVQIEVAVGNHGYFDHFDRLVIREFNLVLVIIGGNIQFKLKAGLDFLIWTRLLLLISLLIEPEDWPVAILKRRSRAVNHGLIALKDVLHFKIWLVFEQDQMIFLWWHRRGQQFKLRLIKRASLCFVLDSCTDFHICEI